jgi:hypothetical protein
MSEKTVGTPLFLRVAMALGAVFGIFGTIAGLWGLFRLIVSDGPFSIGEDAATKAEFLTLAGPVLALYVSACLTAGAASWALWKRRGGSRLLLTALLAEFAVGDAAMLALARFRLGVSGTELAIPVTSFSVVVALGLWYLYRKEAVVRYYESVRSTE